MTSVLVAYASLNGATAGLAGWLADELRSHGLDTWVVPMAHVRTVEGFDAAVLGSAVYDDAWAPEASAFVADQAGPLRERPVWLFSSGDVAGLHCPVPAEQASLAALVGARGSVAFGGSLERATTAPVPGQDHAVGPGDWRDERAVRAWAREIAGALASVPTYR